MPKVSEVELVNDAPEILLDARSLDLQDTDLHVSMLSIICPFHLYWLFYGNIPLVRKWINSLSLYIFFPELSV